MTFPQSSPIAIRPTIPQGQPGAGPAQPGSFCSRPVVVASVPFDDRLRNQRISQMASGVGMLAGAAVAHWQDWGSQYLQAMERHAGVDTSDDDVATAVQVLGPVAGAQRP